MNSSRIQVCACIALLYSLTLQGVLAQQPATMPNAPAAESPKQPATLAEQAKTAQQPVMTSNFHVALPHSRNPFMSYMPATVPPLDLRNSPRLENLERDGKLYITLKDAIALALEDNLDLAWFRYNLPIAETDLARTKAGGQANGVNVGVQSGTSSGSGSSGTGSGSGGAGGGSSSAGSATASGGGAGGLVQSTLGVGTTVHGRDPQLYSTGWLDHTTQQLTNTVTTGIPLYHLNTIESQSEYSQNFALGTNIQAYYTGLRQTTNCLYCQTNPTIESNFSFYVYQPVLAGFGLATNNRYIRIAKKNQQLTDLGFKAQVIATITVVENIYWNLVGAYQTELVDERSLSFAQQTLDEDQKQLQLQAIPKLQVMKDESDLAAREGDLTVAKAQLKLNELYLKNALTKAIHDPAFEDMPVVPLDRVGAPNENENKPIDTLIAEAEKNRPDVSMDEIAMQRAQISLSTIKNELLPSLTLYGEYAGTGIGGMANPSCSTSSGCTPEAGLPTGLGGTTQNAFNYTAPEYQVGFQLSVTLRNRQAKADQFRAVLEYRQSEIQFEEQKKNIRFDVRNSQFALQQARARVDALQKARDLTNSTFEITKEEQQLGAKSSYDVLSAQHDLAVSESALVTAQTAYETAKVDINRATGETLDRAGVSIEDAKSGVVSHMTP